MITQLSHSPYSAHFMAYRYTSSPLHSITSLLQYSLHHHSLIQSSFYLHSKHLHYILLYTFILDLTSTFISPSTAPCNSKYLNSIAFIILPSSYTPLFRSCSPFSLLLVLPNSSKSPHLSIVSNSSLPPGSSPKDTAEEPPPLPSHTLP